MRIHEIGAELDGCTHLQEGQHLILRMGEGDEQFVQHRIEVRGGIVVGGVFLPQRVTGYPTQWGELPPMASFWTPARIEDWQEFQEEFEADSSQPVRLLEERLTACLLEYFKLVEVGARPVVEPEPEPDNGEV